jgi:6-phosphogluconolactonase
MTLDVQTVESPDDLARTVAMHVAHRTLEAITERGVAHVVLTGGGDGVAVTRELGRLGHALPWEFIHLWWGDERFVAEGHEDRNDAQVRDILDELAGLRPDHVHRMPAAGHQQPAAAYSEELAAALGDDPFDVLMLGIGPDGHVASLFPGRDPDGAGATVIEVTDSPKPPPHRITLTMPRLNKSRHAFLFTSGSDKADAVAGLRAQDRSLPVAHVRALESTRLVIDTAAGERAADGA